jgi:hypothetical protein
MDQGDSQGHEEEVSLGRFPLCESMAVRGRKRKGKGNTGPLVSEIPSSSVIQCSRLGFWAIDGTPPVVKQLSAR